MRNLSLLILLTVLTAACAAPTKVDFNAKTALDQDVQGEDRIKIDCGKTFTANFTNTDSSFGSLEVNNDGGCNVKVLVSEFVGGVGGAATKVAEFEVPPGTGNFTAFPLSQNKKFNLLFTCDSSTAAKECEFTYRFSTGKEAAKPAIESPKIDERSVMPEGQEMGNLCITRNPAIGKVISNLTKGEMRVDYTAQSTCKCVPFTVFSDPRGGGDREANTRNENGSDTGTAIVAAGKTITIKAKCGDAVKPGKCTGIVKDIKVSIKTK